MPLNWTPQNVRKAVLNDVAANAEIVGKFVESDARRRLLRITDPDWGAGYRRMIATFLLTNEVEKKTREVIIRVGVRVSASSRHHGFYIELGTRKRAAHPWLRPAVFENRSKIVKLLSGK